MTENSVRDWRKACVSADASLHQVIHVLNDAALKIALVVSPEDVLLGTITDGDIRRGLLRGLDMSSPIDSIVNREAFVVPPGLPRKAVIHLMRTNKLLQLPIVDVERRLLGLHLWDEIAEVIEKQNLVVIMAGGQGKRLRPHTTSCPKPLLPVAGKPMLQHIIERAKQEGFNRFMIAIHYLGEMIEGYFGDGARLGVRIDYLRETSPLGTAGALSLLNPWPDLPFVVINGDVISDIRHGEILDFHQRHESMATMAVRLHEWQHPFGVVQTNGIEIIGFEEKPVVRSHINAGVYVLCPSALKSMSEGAYCDMPTLFERLQARGQRTVAYPMHEPWLDVGQPDDLAKANREHDRHPQHSNHVYVRQS